MDNQITRYVKCTNIQHGSLGYGWLYGGSKNDFANCPLCKNPVAINIRFIKRAKQKG